MSSYVHKKVAVKIQAIASILRKMAYLSNHNQSLAQDSYQNTYRQKNDQSQIVCIFHRDSKMFSHRHEIQRLYSLVAVQELLVMLDTYLRSEERRVGKECRSG